MAETVRWSPLARGDLREAAAYIAVDSSAYAEAFVKDVLEAAGKLAAYPRVGHVVPEFNQSDLREIPVRRHRLIYQVRSDGVLIAALIHGARDLPRAWTDRDWPDVQ